MKKRTAVEWAEMAGVEIIDADGWKRRDGVTLDTPIDIIDFGNRVSESTICPTPEPTYVTLIIERLTNLLKDMPVNPKPTITPCVVSEIAHEIKDATDSDYVHWSELTDRRLRYELCVHFGWVELQESYGG